jgi:hypothetical protein
MLPNVATWRARHHPATGNNLNKWLRRTPIDDLVGRSRRHIRPVARTKISSLDHSVGTDQDCRRNRQAKRGGRLQVERQYETCRLLDR